MWFGFLLLIVTLASASATLNFKDIGTGRLNMRCEMDPNTCNCFTYRPFGGCNYNLDTCTCLWIYLARNTDAKQSPPESTNITSTSRISTQTCHVDLSTCLCNYEPVTVPNTDVIEPIRACLTHSSTCECGWDMGVGGLAQFASNQPKISTNDKCVTDYSKCTCLVGAIVTPPETEASLVNKITSFQTFLLSLIGTLENLLPRTQRMALEPLGALKGLTFAQRKNTIAESVVIMMQLKEMIKDAELIGRIERDDGHALVAQLSGDVKYLTAVSRDSELLAAQIGEIGQPIVARLSKVAVAFEEAIRKVKRD